MLATRSTSPFASTRSEFGRSFRRSNRLNLSEELPALRTSIFIRTVAASASPDLRHVLAVRPHVAPVVDQLVAQFLPQVRRDVGQLRHAVDHIDRQMEAVDLVAARTYRTAWSWCLLPCSRARASCWLVRR